MNYPLIIGDGVIPEAEAVRDVQMSLAGRPDVVLLAHVASVLGQDIPKGSIIYNLEPLFDGCRSLRVGYLDVLRKYRVWDYQAKNVEFLATHGIEAMHVPYRYAAAQERFSHGIKDIDVLFFGSMSPRRAEIISKIPGIITAQGCYGRELDELVPRARIVVNLHYCSEPHPLEVVRLNYLMANGCFVVSEPGWDEHENAAYAPGIVFAEDIPGACAQWLQQDRQALEAAARATIRSMPMRVPQ